MNAVPASENFVVVSSPVWLVLRCSPARTLALAAALADRGAWTPTWKVSREVKGSNKRVKVTEPCIAGFVFVPTSLGVDLPPVPKIPYGFMRQPDFKLTRVPDCQLTALRHIADKPLLPAAKLPRPGERWKMVSGLYAGFTVRVLHCTQRYATLAVEDEASPFAQNVQLPPSILQESAVKAEPVRRASRHRNRT